MVAAPPGPPELEDGAGGRCPGSDGLWSHPHWNYRLPPALLRRRPGKGLLHPRSPCFSVFLDKENVNCVPHFSLRYRTYCCRIDIAFVCCHNEHAAILDKIVLRLNNMRECVRSLRSPHGFC